MLVFWSYFETRIERLFRETGETVPEKVMDHLYLGYGKVAVLLRRVQRCRNRFTHDHPEAIDDTLVEELMAGLKDEHEGWIAVFNARLQEGRKRPVTLHG